MNNTVAVDGTKPFVHAMQQSYKEEHLNKINFNVYSLRSVHRFCLFFVFIERMMLFIITVKEQIFSCEHFIIKLSILFCFSFTCAALPLNIMKVLHLVFFFLNKPKFTVYSNLCFILTLQF